MQRTLLVVALTFTGLTGCGGSAPQGKGTNAVTIQRGDSDAASDEGVSPDAECHDERAIGSSIPRRVCRSKDETERERAGGREYVNQLRPRATTSK